jgi:hypothetical protein
MRNDELESDLKQLSEHEREEAEYLLKLARVRKITKPSRMDTEERSEERDITFVEARRELIYESNQLREEIVSQTGKVLKRKLSKTVRKNLGIKDAGRPRGSKNQSSPMSKTEFYKKLKTIVKSNCHIGVETTLENAAKAVGLGGGRQLRRKLKMEYDDPRKWKEIVEDLEAE